jgi:Flp pilus assembly protein TadD
VTADGESAYELFRRGCRFLDDGHPGQAALLLARALELEPDKTSIRESLGRAWYAMRRYDDAAAAFAGVVERAPANAYAQFGLARSLLCAGRARAALAHARLAVAMQPDRDEFRDALAECLARTAESQPHDRAERGCNETGTTGAGGLDES